MLVDCTCNKGYTGADGTACTACEAGSFKEVNVRGSYGAIVSVVIVFIVLIIEPGLNFVLIGLLSVGHGPVEWLWRKRTGGTLEALAVAEAAADGGSDAAAASEGNV